MTHEHVTDEGLIVEEEYDYYEARPNDLRSLSEMQDWQIVEGEPDIRGWAVVNQNGDQIARIDDLMVSEEAGAAIMALVGFGGFLGMGEKRTLVPIDWLELNMDRKQAVFLGSDEDLKNAPEYNKDTRDFGGFYEYWGSKEPEWTEVEEVEVTDLTGWRVYDEHDHEIGQVDGLVTDDGHAFAVIGYGRFWDMATRQTLVPLDRLSMDEENHRLVLDMTADHLKSAPEYTGQTGDYGAFYDYWGTQRQAA